jgi:hypothetical protein
MSGDIGSILELGAIVQNELKLRDEANRLAEAMLHPKPAPRKTPRPKRARPDAQLAKPHKPTNREKRRQRRQAKRK